MMGNIRAFWIHFGIAAALVGGLAALVCLGFVLRRGDFHEGVAAALFLGPLLSPHTYWQDYSLGAVAVLLVPNRFLRYLVLLPWPFFSSRRDLLPIVPIS